MCEELKSGNKAIFELNLTRALNAYGKLFCLGPVDLSINRYVPFFCSTIRFGYRSRGVSIQREATQTKK